MAQEQTLRRIDWCEALPFVRIFSAARCATATTPLVMGFLAVVLIYFGGRALDAVWLATGAGFTNGLGAASRPIDTPLLESLRLAAIEAGLHPTSAQDATSESRSVGPFAALVIHAQVCFGAGIQSAAAGRIGVDGLVGAALDGLRGLIHLAEQRPFFTILLFIWVNAVLAYYGGAISRYVAIRVGLDEYVTFAEASQFAWDKWLQLFGATSALLVAGGAVGLLMILGGLIGAIPYLGELFVGVSFFLTLIGGIVLAALTVALVAGFPLIWPAIAVEGSDAGDGLMRSGAYIRSRPWSAGFYAVAGLFGLALALVVARLLALLALKLTHVFSRIGVGAFGAAGSSGDASLNKLDGIWKMPAWSDLPLLPSVGGTPFWGVFGLDADLGWAGVFAQYMIMLWVFALVAVVGGYVISYYFAAATGAYMLLRWEVDRIPPNEVFYETLDDGMPAGEPEFSEPLADSSDGSSGGEAPPEEARRSE